MKVWEDPNPNKSKPQGFVGREEMGMAVIDSRVIMMGVIDRGPSSDLFSEFDSPLRRKFKKIYRKYLKTKEDKLETKNPCGEINLHATKHYYSLGPAADVFRNNRNK